MGRTILGELENLVRIQAQVIVVPRERDLDEGGWSPVISYPCHGEVTDIRTALQEGARTEES